MRVFNTLTRRIEDFISLQPNRVLFYHCGPTVYWTQHIGNMRAVVCGDLVVRSLRFLGYTVTHVRNYTDVGHLTSDADVGEDKMEKGAKREGLSPTEIANKYIDIYVTDVKRLNTQLPTHSPRATDYINEMKEMVATLIEKGFAYQTDLAIYFDVTLFKQYTELSHQKMNELMSGAGAGDVSDSQKKHAADFALWFFKKGIHKDALQTWESKWGSGFPGWHIECSAMSKKLLGDQLDIHMGGIEHIPVHHTNEIAQSESANGTKFVNYWLHNEHLVVDDAKMAKSSGTSYSLQELVDKGYHPLVLRYFFLQAHYRSKQNFTFEALNASQNALENLYQALWLYRHSREPACLALRSIAGRGGNPSPYKQHFLKAIEDDFNIPAALAVLWDLLSSSEQAETKWSLALEFDKVLGLRLEEVLNIIIPEEIKKLAEKRQALRVQKKFKEADEARQELEKQGYEIEDKSEGGAIKPKSILSFISY